MSLTGVKMSEEVWLTCVTHALSTETEEIMGLLLGDIEHSKSGKATALIWGAAPQTRSDRRKDRVETNPEQLAAASAMAERMSSATGRRTRVIGWYHSHPHITVLPSHVDVRTQAMYQLLDSGFIGLIFSCFNEDALKVGRIQVIAFQSLDGNQSYLSAPITVLPQMSTVIDLESSVSSDDALTRLGSGMLGKHELDTGDSKSAVRKPWNIWCTDLVLMHTSFIEIGNVASELLSHILADSSFPPDDVGDSFVDIDPMDMSDGMQEAMHRSHMEMSSAEYIRKEIPLQVLPALSLLKLDSPLASFTDLQRVLYKEEKAAYSLAISQNMREGKVHPLTFIHHTSTYQASMCKLMEYCLAPAIEALENRLQENEVKLGMLTEEAKVLEAEASRGVDGNTGSPHRVDGVRGSPSPAHSVGEPMNPRSPGSRSKKGH